VCCSVLQCVAVCCSVLQCVAVCCSVLQCVAVCCSMLQCVAVRCIVLQRYISLSNCTGAALSCLWHDASYEWQIGISGMIASTWVTFWRHMRHPMHSYASGMHMHLIVWSSSYKRSYDSHDTIIWWVTLCMYNLIVRTFTWYTWHNHIRVT